MEANREAHLSDIVSRLPWPTLCQVLRFCQGDPGRLLLGSDKPKKNRGWYTFRTRRTCKGFFFHSGKPAGDQWRKSSNTYLKSTSQMPMDFDRTHVLIEHTAPHHTYCRYRRTPTSWKPPHGRFTLPTPAFASYPKKDQTQTARKSGIFASA